MNNLKIALLLPLLALFHLATIAQGAYGIVIHGGAGVMDSSRFTKAEIQLYEDALQEAVSTGYKLLEEGHSAEKAVVAALSILENHPLFNAGRGSVLNEKGQVEMDASIMRGNDLNAGAVAGVTNIKNPIMAAAAVMNHSPHVMLSGEGAVTFAKEQGLATEPSKYFITPARKASWEKYKTLREGSGSVDTNSLHWQERKFGTVGAVALDRDGHLAAATSTGGMTFKQYGRIGDSPIIGAGTYANNRSCAVSCTGHGEYFIRLGIAKEVSALMLYRKWDVDKAAQYVIHQQLPKLGGTGGLIAIDRKGNISMPFNTSGMFRGYQTSTMPLNVAIFK